MTPRLLALDLVGLSSRPGDFLFRESPSLRSTGKTIVADTCPECGRPVPIYRVSSFLDIFAEASADGGQTWAPGDKAIPVVQQAEPIALGDYNQNGTVDAADYVLWRKLVGTGALPNEGGVSNNLVDEADYQFWRWRLRSGGAARTRSVRFECARAVVVHSYRRWRSCAIAATLRFARALMHNRADCAGTWT